MATSDHLPVPVNFPLFCLPSYDLCYIEFFEECIEEEKFAAQKLEIMREAIHAQPQYKKSVDNFVAEGDLSPEPMSPGPEGGPDIKISSEQDQPLPSNGNGASSHIEVEEQNGSH